MNGVNCSEYWTNSAFYSVSVVCRLELFFFGLVFLFGDISCNGHLIKNSFEPQVVCHVARSPQLSFFHVAVAVLDRAFGNVAYFSHMYGLDLQIAHLCSCHSIVAVHGHRKWVVFSSFHRPHALDIILTSAILKRHRCVGSEDFEQTLTAATLARNLRNKPNAWTLAWRLASSRVLALRDLLFLIRN